MAPGRLSSPPSTAAAKAQNRTPHLQPQLRVVEKDEEDGHDDHRHAEDADVEPADGGRPYGQRRAPEQLRRGERLWDTSPSPEGQAVQYREEAQGDDDGVQDRRVRPRAADHP